MILTPFTIHPIITRDSELACGKHLEFQVYIRMAMRRRFQEEVSEKYCLGIHNSIEL